MPTPDRPAVIFDLGGVVLRWNSRDVIATAPLSEPIRAALAEHLLPSPDWLEFDRGTLDLPDIIERSATRSGLDPDTLSQFFEHVGDYMCPRSETLALVEELDAQGTPLYVLSNMPRHYIDLLEARHGFFNRFQRVYASARIGLIKPEPEIYRHVLSDADLIAADCWFIDDLPANVSAARDAGINALQFHDAASCRDSLVSAGVLPA